jgi:hypothetical protein
VSDSKLRDWLEIAGILAVVASLVFVGLENRRSSRVAFEEAIVSDYGTMIAVEEVVVDNADVRLRGCRAEALEPIDNVFRCGLN